jgi:hypothetical protein
VLKETPVYLDRIVIKEVEVPVERYIVQVSTPQR